MTEIKFKNGSYIKTLDVKESKRSNNPHILVYDIQENTQKIMEKFFEEYDCLKLPFQYLGIINDCWNLLKKLEDKENNIMSVAYYSCDRCGNIFSDCGYYVSCECGNKWCDDDCAEEDGYVSEHCKKYNVYGDDDMYCKRILEKCKYRYCCDCPEYVPSSCNYCRNEDYPDDILLDYCLKLLGKSRKDIVKQYNKESK